LQNYPSDRFSGDFADLWHLMQPPCSKEYVNLHQIPKIGLPAFSIGMIDKPLSKLLWFFKLKKLIFKK